MHKRIQIQTSTYYMIPFLQSSQVGKSNLWWRKIRIVAASMWDCGGD